MLDVAQGGTSVTTGAINDYSDGTSGSPGTNRALGMVATSTSGLETIAVELTNTTGLTLTQATISYTGEEWNDGTTVGSKTLNFGYAVTSTAGTTGSQPPAVTGVSSLNFTSPVSNGVGKSLDGTLAANQQQFNNVVVPITGGWANGQVLWLTWTISSTTGQEPGLAIDNFSFSAAAAAPTVTTNTGLTANLNQGVNLTSSMLSSTDPNGYSASQVTYTVTSLPTTGTLSLSGTAQTATGGTFTQAQLNSGTYVSYTAGSSTASTSFGFSVADPSSVAATGSFSIGVGAPAPVLATNSPLALTQGTSATITTSNLKVTDSDPSVTDSGLTFTIGTAPAHGTLKDSGSSLSAGGTFTEQDLDNGNVTYTNDGTANTSDSFTFTVLASDGGTIGITTFNINVTGILTVAANTGLSVNPGQGATLTSSLLSVSDSLHGPSSLTYTIGTAPTAGTLYKGTTVSGGTVLSAGSTFTQADINSGNLFYLSTGTTAASDSFTFTVSDGAGGTLGSTSFALNVVALSSVSYTGNHTTYSQNFDGLPSSGTYTLYSVGPIAFDTSSIPTTGLAGWSFAGSASPAKFAVGDGAGATTSGAVYSFGAGTNTPGFSATGFNGTTPGTQFDPSTDRALGLIGTSAEASTVGVTLVNTSGVTLTQVTISYDGQVWHFGTGSTANPLTFGYALGAASITDLLATFHNDATLNYSVTPNGTAQAFDGNDPANFTATNDTIGGLSWASGQTLVLRWSIGGVGQAPGLAIDNFHFSAAAAPTVATNTGLTVPPNQSANITSSMLSTTDLNGYTTSQLTYTVTSLPTNGTLSLGGVAQTATGGTFTEAQLDTGTYVSFTAGSTNGSSSFGFSVADPSPATTTGTFLLGVGAPAPVLAVNSPLILVQGATAAITTSDLKVTDSDGSVTDSGLTFTIGTTPAHGTLSLSGTHLSAGGTFTQQDLDNSSVTYTNDGTANASDSFTFTVLASDGGTIGTTTFNINVNLLPVLANDTGLNTPVGATTLITKTLLQATGTGSASKIQYTLTSVPTSGHLYNTAVSTTVPLGVGSTFNQSTINGTSTIEYVSNSSASPGSSDSFGFTVTDTSYTSSPPSISGTFAITNNPSLSSVSYSGGAYTQTFSGLPSSVPTQPGGTAGELDFAQSGPFDLDGNTNLVTSPQGAGATGMSGWSMTQIGGSTANEEKVLVDSGSTSTGGVHAYSGSAASVPGQQALGLVSTGSNQSAIALTLVNNTSVTLTQFTLSYDGEEWRIGADNPLQVSYSVNGASFSAPVTALGYDGTTGSAGPNGTVTDTLKSSTITGLSWGPGQTLAIRWAQAGGVSGAEGLGITNVSFSAQISPVLNANAGLTLNQGHTSSITNSMLSVTEAGLANSHILYTLVTAPTHGALNDNGTTLTAGGTFTQADIDNGLLTYSNDGSANTSDAFQFTVSDGAQGSIASTTFSITINSATAPNVLINEIETNPPGSADNRYEYVELSGTPGQSLANVSFVTFDGIHTNNLGTADLVVDLSGFTLGSNGLLVIQSSTSAGHSIPTGTTVVTDPTFFTQSGGFANGTLSFYLFYGSNPFTQGTDYDTNDDGTLDNLPSGSEVLDHVAILNNNASAAGDIAYGNVVVTESNSTGSPDAITRFPGNTAIANAAWYGGELGLATDTDPSEVNYDPTRASANEPAGAVLTPGAANLIPITITWSNPADITYGTALGSSQLNATASAGGSSVPGTFSYTLANGTTSAGGVVLGAGQNQVLKVTFTPTDTVNYSTASAQVDINVDAKAITIKANDQTQTYGSISLGASAFSITSGSLVSGDSITGVTLTQVDINSLGCPSGEQGS